MLTALAEADGRAASNWLRHMIHAAYIAKFGAAPKGGAAARKPRKL